MADQTEDISSFEDIGQRLDDLLDALEASTQEVAQTGSSLDKSLDELEAAQVASQGDAVIDDSGAVSRPPPARDAQPAPEPEEAQAEEPEAEEESSAEAPPELSDDASEEAPTEASAESPAAPTSVDDGEQDAEAQGAPQAVPEAPPAAATEPPRPASGEAPEVKNDADDSSLIDDGLLIEPESQQRPDDIDGAPAGASNLENELDEELDALLASGMFEDPLADLDPDESATPVELPEEGEAATDSSEPESDPARASNLPADEAELISELDEQLAALADAELSEPEQAEPAAEPIAQAEAEAEVEKPDDSAGQESAQPSPEPAPAVASRSATPAGSAPAAAQGWKARLPAIVERSRPVAQRSWAQTRAAMIAGATRVNKPLQDKPHLKQVVGWVALVHVFYAACLWAYVALWHEPPTPPPATAQPTIKGEQAP